MEKRHKEYDRSSKLFYIFAGFELSNSLFSLINPLSGLKIVTVYLFQFIRGLSDYIIGIMLF